MALEVATAIKTVQGLIDVVWQVYKLVDRYKVLPDRLWDTAEGLQACEVDLSVWKARWCVREDTSHVYYEFLWSQRGWQTIQSCMGSIEEISKLLHISVNALIGTAFWHQGHNHRERFNGQYNARRFRKAMDRIDKHMSRRKRFFAAVMLRADDLAFQLGRFERKITALQRFANGYVLSVHPTLEGEAPHMLPYQARRRVEHRIRQAERNLVKGNRKDAESLHRAYAGCESLDCHLALAKVDPEHRRLGTSDTQLYFLLADNLRTTEIHFRPVDIFDTSEIRQASRSLVDAYSMVARNWDGATDLIPPGAKSGAGFELRAVNRSSLVGLNTTAPLSILLASRPNFSTRQLLAIAVSLVEGCHRFLGTPWLSHLDTANIRGEQGRESKAWTVMLGAAAGNRSVTQALAQFASLPANRRRNLDHHLQLFRLGIVLAELALGSLVTYADASTDARGPGVSIVMQDYAYGERLDAHEIAAAVEASAGETYAGLVEFCLGTCQERSIINKPGGLDEEFENRLLDP